jgi:peptidoglycan/xylan/chitin deacetylase (PgdA/CDA1 family)
MDKFLPRQQYPIMSGHRLILLLLCFGFLSFQESPTDEAQQSGNTAWPGTIIYRNTPFVALPNLEHWFGIGVQGASSISFDGREWKFLNGGQKIRLPGGKEKPLAYPLLYLNGMGYLDRDDVQSLFGIELSEKAATFRGRRVEAKAIRLTSDYHNHQVTALSSENAAIRLTADVNARSALHASSPEIKLNVGSVFIVRRKAVIDGIHYAILTDAGPNPVSVIVEENALKYKFIDAELDKTVWHQRIAWFKKAAAAEQGLRNGERSKLSKSVCVTIDLCWSTHPFEEKFLMNLPVLAKESDGASAAFFVCGRWMEQHPTEMEALLNLEQKGANLTWGLHSWVHPISGGFMNELSVAEVREDTLRVERELLEWGIVPTVYYRFPGLIHDTARLSAILDLGLLPIDCDAWVAVQETNHPFGHAIQDGSIVLLHGNGNEPQGIARFETWLSTHHDWEWKSLPDFLPDQAQ